MTVASPLARQYYFMWLFFPMTILIHRAAYDPRPAVRAGSWAALAIAGLLIVPVVSGLSERVAGLGQQPRRHRRDRRRDWSGIILHPLRQDAPRRFVSDSWRATTRFIPKLAPQARKPRHVQRAATATGPRPHRCRFRQQPGAAVRAVADQVDLGRSGVCRRLQGGRRSSGQGHRDARFCHRGPADRRAIPPSSPRATARATAACRRSARAVLRSLRCAAGRSAQSLASAAVRTRRHRLMPTVARSSSRAAPRTTRAS